MATDETPIARARKMAKQVVDETLDGDFRMKEAENAIAKLAKAVVLLAEQIEETT